MMKSKIMRFVRSSDDEHGVAMVLVLGVIMVGAVIMTSLAAVTLYSTNYSTYTRQEMRAYAAADGGIDLMFEMLDGVTYAQVGGVCSQSVTIDSTPVNISTSYTVKRSDGTIADVECPGINDVVSKLVITSQAEVNGGLYRSEGSMERSVVATMVPTPPEVLLNKAIFSEGEVVITNDSKLIESEEGANDAHVYSNNSVVCRTQVDTGGSIYAAHGNVVLENNCQVHNGVWASGYAHLSSGTSVRGDLYAASNTGPGGRSVVMQNTAYVTGNVLTNGNVWIQGKYNENRGVLGSVFSYEGSIELDSNGGIRGSAYSATGISLNNGARVGRDAFTRGSITSQNNNYVDGNAKATGTIATSVVVVGTREQGVSVTVPQTPNPAAVFPAGVGYPNKIQPPTREPLPYVDVTDEDLALWEGAGYVVERPVGVCNSNQVRDYINDGAWSTARLVIFNGCSSSVDMNNVELKLGNNLAMVSSNGFSASNDLKVVSTDPGFTRDLHWIVPASVTPWTGYGNGASPVACSNPAISINKIFIKAVNWLMYSPCKIHIQNGLGSGSDPFIGQMYGGSVILPNAVHFQMGSVPIPSLATEEPNMDSPVEFRLTSRFDVAPSD